MSTDIINTKVELILDKFHIYAPPIDVFSIANQLGFPVKGLSMQAEEVSAFTDFEGKRIFVNLDDEKFRQTFSVAHELGHLVLHLELILKNESLYQLFMSSSPMEGGIQDLEAEANEFAANLLVPSKLLKVAVDTYSSNIAISRFFGVEEWLILKRRFKERI